MTPKMTLKAIPIMPTPTKIVFTLWLKFKSVEYA